MGDNHVVEEGGILDTVARQARVARDTSNRPRPLPDSDWSLAETRRDMLLAHWPVALDDLARLLPPDLPVETFDGEAWLGLIACRVEGFRARGLPPLPGLSSGPQLEVATYVNLDDHAGLWFFSVERPGALLVEVAKRSHRLPAYKARVSSERVGEEIRFEVEREGSVFRARYAPSGESRPPRPGTLESFLLDRFSLYTADGGRLYRAELHRSPSRVQQAAAVVEVATIGPVPLQGTPLCLFAAVEDVLVWPLEEL